VIAFAIVLASQRALYKILFFLIFASLKSKKSEKTLFLVLELLF